MAGRARVAWARTRGRGWRRSAEHFNGGARLGLRRGAVPHRSRHAYFKRVPNAVCQSFNGALHVSAARRHFALPIVVLGCLAHVLVRVCLDCSALRQEPHGETF